MSSLLLGNSSFVRSLNGTADDPCSVAGSVSHVLMCSLVILLGVPGNCIIIRVYWAKARKTSTHVLIMGLAWADLLACLLLVHAILTNCIFGIGDGSTALRILRYFLLSSVVVSVHITSLIAFDRYDCICRFQRRFLNHRRAVVAVFTAPFHSMAIASIYLAVLGYPDSTAAPLILCAVQIVFYTTALALIVVCYGFVYRTIRTHVRLGIGDNRISSRHSHTAGRQTKTAYVERKSANQVNSISLLSAATRPNPDTCEVQIMSDNDEPKPSNEASSASKANVKVNKQGSFTRLAWTKPLGSKADSGAPSPVGNKILTSTNQVLQRKTTRMLMLTSVVFLLSWIPYWIYIASLLARICGAQISPQVDYALENFAYVKYLNSAVNPLIYSLANRRFRKDCKDLLKKYNCC